MILILRSVFYLAVLKAINGINITIRIYNYKFNFNILHNIETNLSVDIEIILS